MGIRLSTIDRRKFERLAEIMEMNNEVVGLLSTYLTDCPNFVTEELIHNFCEECGVPEEEAFRHLLIVACGLNIENNVRDRQLAVNYLMSAVRKLDSREYKTNPYYMHLRIPQVRFGDWELKYEKYIPYEAFVCNEIVLDEDFKEIPQIGFFDTEFSFPAVMQNNNEWMAIKPNEVETMQRAIELATGCVVTFGLGLGYYAYMVSEKSAVESVTIIEKDNVVISLFKTYILPQFPGKQKVTIIQADAFEYAIHQMPVRKYNYAFVDLWHDVLDGYPLYLEMKKLESLSPETTFLYWIEDSLLSHMRWRLFHQMQEALSTDNKNIRIPEAYLHFTYDQLIQKLKNPFLRKLAQKGK